MKIISSLAVILLGIQSLCVGVCVGMDVPLAMGMPPCHGVTLPNADDQSAKIDPCIERVAIETRTASILDHVILAVAVHPEIIVVEPAPSVFDSLYEFSEAPSPPMLRLVLRI